MCHDEIISTLRRLADPGVARTNRRFFKCGPGQYGEGDVFWGIRVPALRRLAREHRECQLEVVARLLDSPVHEQRLLGLVMLSDRYERSNRARRAAVYDFYWQRIDRVNNWDLVDLSAPAILGRHLAEAAPRGRALAVLDGLARSGNLWRRRIAIVATLAMTRRDWFEPTLRIARRLLDDPEDLIHKATGWMLRELGKREPAALEAFLSAHAARMPRTMLRYAIERLPAAARRGWLAAGKAGAGGMDAGKPAARRGESQKTPRKPRKSKKLTRRSAA